METTNTTTNDNSVIVESPMSTSSSNDNDNNNNNSVLSNEVSTPGPTPVEEDKHHNDFAQQMTDSIYDVHAHASEMMQIDSNANDSANDTNGATVQVETADSANNNAVPLSPQVVKEQLKYCQRILKGLKRHREAGPFLLPVDPVALNIPDYFTVIKQPMDLSTVSKKLDLNEYATADAFMADVRLMLTNCFTYNAPDSQVTKMGRNIEKYFNTSMAKMASEISGGAVSGDSNTSGNHAATMMKSQASSSSLARPKRESVSTAAPAVRRGSSSSASLTFCSSVLRELMKKTNAHLNWPFMIPVDPVALNLPDYFDVVKTPMDLGTIRKKLDTGMYASPDQFEADVHLVFSNCYAYNPPESDVTRMGRELEAIFQQKMSQKPAPKAPAAAVSHALSHAVSASSSSVSLSHSHHHGNFIPSSASQLIPGLDSLEDDSEKILAINHQIQILQAELNYLLINRKSSSSASLMSHRNNASSSLDNNNKSTASAGKPRKKASPASSSNLSSKASPPVMSDISFEEKRQLSEDVSNLSQDNMMRVLEIIQECMPNLNSSGDSEVIELDIEALDVRTLRALQQYIWECMNPGKKRKMTKSPAPPPQSSTINSSQIPQSTTSTTTTTSSSNTTTTAAAPQDKKPKLESSDQQANFDSSSSSSSEDDD